MPGSQLRAWHTCSQSSQPLNEKETVLSSFIVKKARDQRVDRTTTREVDREREVDSEMRAESSVPDFRAYVPFLYPA